MEPLSFLILVLIATTGGILAKSHSNAKKIEEIQDKISNKESKQKTVQ